jgi:maltokinase
MTTTTPHAWAAAVLPWVSRQRWFPGKGLEVRSSGIRHEMDLGAALWVLLVEFDYLTRPRELYQIPVLVRQDPPVHDGTASAQAYIGGGPDGSHLYDAAKDPEGSSRLLRFMAAGGHAGVVSGHAVETLEELMPEPVTSEQSNTSVIFGNRYIMKTLRQMWPDRNPDLALTLALDAEGSAHSARTLAWMSAQVDGEEYTLATVQRFLQGAQMGWPMVLASVQRALDDGPRASDDFTHEAFLLGVATAEVHATLAASMGVGTLNGDVEGIVAKVQNRWQVLSLRLPELTPFEERVGRLVADFATTGPELRTQRIHNDLHLTQVMRTDATWVLIDFEGEPNASIHDRNRLVSPWRDVACMLRSFDYGAFYLRPNSPDSAAAQHRVDDWLNKTRAAYLEGYTSISGLPSHAETVALRLYELEKALFEIDYEMTYRPTWLERAVQATVHLLGTVAAQPLPPDDNDVPVQALQPRPSR